jgi:hypothetical protein
MLASTGVFAEGFVCWYRGEPPGVNLAALSLIYICKAATNHFNGQYLFHNLHLLAWKPLFQLIIASMPSEMV